MDLHLCICQILYLPILYLPNLVSAESCICEIFASSDPNLSVYTLRWREWLRLGDKIMQKECASLRQDRERMFEGRHILTRDKPEGFARLAAIS
jgi:hypothetical protein